MRAAPRVGADGSMCGWGDVFKNDFTRAVYLYVPTEVRMARIIERDRADLVRGLNRGGDMYERIRHSCNGRAKYDTAGLEMRSRRCTNNGCATLTLPGAADRR